MQTINSIGLNFVRIPSGEFFMGSPPGDLDADDDEFPQHGVDITQTFLLGVDTVSVGQFRQFVSETNYKTEAETSGDGGWGFNPNRVETFDLPFEQSPRFDWRNTGFPQTEGHPVVNVSWNDANAFCEWMSAKEDVRYRLPTEAEWEFACRAGSSQRFPFGNDEAGLQRVANIADQSLHRVYSKISWAADWDDTFPFTAPAGSMEPNAFGLYQMLGNVWEWCRDWYSDSYYALRERVNPRGPLRGDDRVLRGGSWLNVVELARPAVRNGSPPDHRDTFTGFRIAREDDL